MLDISDFTHRKGTWYSIIASGWDPVVGPFDQGTGPVDAITGKEFRDHVNNRHFLGRTLHHCYLYLAIISIYKQSTFLTKYAWKFISRER
jgi:hypothetical protein